MGSKKLEVGSTKHGVSGYRVLGNGYLLGTWSALAGLGF